MNIKRAYTLAIIVMLGFGLMLGYAFYQLLRVERSLASYVGENMLWAVNQADRETRRFSDALLLDNTDKDMVLLRLEILQSRIKLLSEGPQLDYFQKIGADTQLKNIVETVGRVEQHYGTGDNFALSDILSLYREIQPVFSDFGRIANLSMIYERDVGGANRDRQLQIIYLITAAVLGLMTVGGLLSWLLIVNINSANRANQELLRYQEKLEAIVEQRTNALSVALRNEKKANEIYKGFLTTVSHQFKTPVAIIDLIAQRFIRHPQDIDEPNVLEAAGRIRESVSRLSRIIESTISGEIVDHEGVKLNKSDFDLVEMISETIAYHKEIYAERVVDFDQQVQAFPYHGDKTLLEQIIVNLLANAEKYSPQNTPVIVVVSRVDDVFLCRIKDFGAGIPTGEADMIFSRFYRASNVAHLSGSGLGLSFSRQIAEMHGGELDLAAFGEGYTEFELRLPVTGG